MLQCVPIEPDAIARNLRAKMLDCNWIIFWPSIFSDRDDSCAPYGDIMFNRICTLTLYVFLVVLIATSLFVSEYLFRVLTFCSALQGIEHKNIYIFFLELLHLLATPPDSPQRFPSVQHKPNSKVFIWRCHQPHLTSAAHPSRPPHPPLQTPLQKKKTLSRFDLTLSH